MHESHHLFVLASTGPKSLPPNYLFQYTME